MSAPKNYIIRCPKCRWAETSTGISSELTHLHEIKNNCSNCGKPRAFRCPTCAATCKMLKIKVRP